VSESDPTIRAALELFATTTPAQVLQLGKTAFAVEV
jgi:hypothetical protein